MSRERHRRSEELFSEAVELPARERIAFLDRECAGDPELRQMLVELLDADAPLTESAGGNLLRSLEQNEVQGAASYRVLHEIGRGGMGIVHLAERSDGAFRRKVALKVLQVRALGDEELVRRFRSERRILASLEHPHIARLLDGGELADGTPFLVMELVEGRPLDRYLQDVRPTIDERLELFLKICDAVQVAHQSLVVHRDLKPSNVLVDADGEPKLLDFGIAKILDEGAADWTLAETRRGQQPLTPRYASPEQLSAGAVTTATDVYALGVLLFESLAGVSPYRPEGSAPHQWAAAVCEQEPLRPSAAVRQLSDVDGHAERSRIERRLAGDLDHIVLKALRKESRERYASAAELAADLRRHLRGLPIVARKPTFSYRSRKFLRRHRLGVAAILAFLLTIGVFTASLFRQLRRTEIERDKAETVAELLVEVFSAAGPGEAGSEPTARQVLDRGMSRLRDGLDDQPEVKAGLLEAVGRVYNNLGRLPEAREALELALELRRPFREAAPLDYAETLERLATVLIGFSDLEQAELLMRESYTLTLEKLGAEDARTLSRLDGLQQVLAKAGRHREAEPLARQVVASTLRRLGHASVEEILDSDSDDGELVAVAVTLASLAAEERQNGHYAAAETDLLDAIELTRRSSGERHYTVALHRNNLANVYSGQGRVELAVRTRAEAIELGEATLGPEHPSVASMRLNQGYDLCRVGRCAQAWKSIERARRDLVAVVGEEHPAVAVATSFAGLAKLGLGETAEALALEDAALELGRRLLDADNVDLAQIRIARARALAAAERRSEAIAELTIALRVQRGALGSDHPETAITQSLLADTLAADGGAGAAEARRLPAS